MPFWRHDDEKASAVAAPARLIEDVRHGRFERTMSAFAAVGAVITTVEIFFEHDKASFGDPWMWVPIAVAPVEAVAATAGYFRKGAAKTVLPAASVLVIANGVQGIYLHARGIAQKPGGWRNFRYNMEMGPPLIAPMLVTLVGGMGILAAILRRER